MQQGVSALLCWWLLGIVERLALDRRKLLIYRQTLERKLGRRELYARLPMLLKRLFLRGPFANGFFSVGHLPFGEALLHAFAVDPLQRQLWLLSLKSGESSVSTATPAARRRKLLGRRCDRGKANQRQDQSGAGGVVRHCLLL